MNSTTSSPPATSWPVADSRARYGTVSRFFHWGMALCFAVVFSAALTHYLAKDSALDAWLWPAHKPTGALLMALVLLRAAWAWMHARQRPPHASLAAHLGHLALYALMIAVPAIALLRQYGSGREFAAFGVRLMQTRPDDKIDWMTQLGSLLHSKLGWVLLAIVAGHIFMALWHRRSAQHNVLPRMTD